MDARIFPEKQIELRRDLLSIPVKKRLIYDPRQNLFFIKLEGLTLNTQEMIADILNLAKQLIDPLGRKVFPIVNYDNFSIELGLVDDYTKMVKYITNRYFLGATRYTICTFVRVKLGEALEGRGGATHPRERAGSARSSSRSGGKSRN